MSAACGQRFNAFDGPQRCGRQKGHRGAHTRDPLPRERAVMEAGEKAKAEARQAASELRSAAKRQEPTADEMAKLAHACRKLIAAHDSRSPSSQHATLGELDALFDLRWELQTMEAVRNV